MTHEVFLSLFEADGKALRQWDPARGASLEGFVACLAHHQVISILRNRRTSPWRDEPTETEQLDEPAPPALQPAQVVESREHLQLLLDQIRGRLSPIGLEVFQQLIVEEEPVDDVCVKLKMTRDAVYQWRRRLLKLVQELSRKIMEDSRSDSPGGSRILKGVFRR